MRNPSQRTRRTNNRINGALENFHINNHRHTINPFPYDFVVSFWSESNEQMSQEFLQVLFDAALEDHFMRTMPFNQTFFETLLSRHRFYFAPVAPGYDGYLGFYRNSDRLIFTAMHHSANNSTNSFFVGTILHEIAHVFGLGESLAHLWSEELRGVTSAEWAGVWFRDSSFDRVLLNTVGAARFWRSAFSSNQIYGELWDEQLGHIVSFEDMQLARTAATEIYFNQQLVPLFLEHAELPALTIASEFRTPGYWADHGRYINHGLENPVWVEGWVWTPPNIIRGENVDTVQYLLQSLPRTFNRNNINAGDTIRLFASFAQKKGMEPTPAFFDEFIINHLTFDDWHIPLVSAS